MRPLRVMSLQNEHGLEFKTVCVLDLLSDFPNPTRTQLIVDECAKDKVSSGASTHKKLGELKEKGFVKEHAHAENKDGRRRYIQITDAGMQFLKQWEEKST